MSDRFDQVMQQYLLPMEKLYGPVDSTYFLHKKGGPVYCEGYAHPPDGFYGALIKYPDPKGHIDIFGRKFNWTHRRYENGELVIIPGDEQVRRMIEIYPELASRPPCRSSPTISATSSSARCRGSSTAGASLELLCRENQRLREVVDSLHELRGAARADRLFGLLAYGYYEEPLEDVDATFFGTVEQNFDVVLRIAELLKREPEREVRELGKSWPLRFKHMGTLVCPSSGTRTRRRSRT